MFILKTSLSLLLFFVYIIYFTIRKVNPLCEKNVLFPGRSSQNHASWTCYVYHHLFAAGRPSRVGPYDGPGRGIFLRAEGYSRRCCQFEMPRCNGIRRGRPVKAARYALRVSRSVVVSLSLSRRSRI